MRKANVYFRLITPGLDQIGLRSMNVDIGIYNWGFGGVGEPQQLQHKFKGLPVIKINRLVRPCRGPIMDRL